MWFFPSFPRYTGCGNAGSGGGEERSGEKSLRLIQIRLVTPNLEKISPASQAQSPQAQIANSSSRKAVNFSSAHKRNALRRLASQFSICFREWDHAFDSAS